MRASHGRSYAKARESDGSIDRSPAPPQWRASTGLCVSNKQNKAEREGMIYIYIYIAHL